MVAFVVVDGSVGSWIEAISPKGRKAWVSRGMVIVASRPPGRSVDF